MPANWSVKQRFIAKMYLFRNAMRHVGSHQKASHRPCYVDDIGLNMKNCYKLSSAGCIIDMLWVDYSMRSSNLSTMIMSLRRTKNHRESFWFVDFSRIHFCFPVLWYSFWVARASFSLCYIHYSINLAIRRYVPELLDKCVKHSWWLTAKINNRMLRMHVICAQRQRMRGSEKSHEQKKYYENTPNSRWLPNRIHRFFIFITCVRIQRGTAR